MAHAGEAHAAEAHTHAPQAFIWRYVFSKDHKVIGTQYYITAMAMALVAGLLAMLIFTPFFVSAGAAAAAWTSSPPLSALQGAIPGSGMGQTLWIVGMVFFIASFTMGGLNFLTTILNLRTKGLSLMRLPLTMWSMMLVAILGLLAFPALVAACLMLIFDRHFGTSFFLPAG